MKKTLFLFITIFFICTYTSSFAQITYYPNDPDFSAQIYLNNELNNMEDVGYLEYYYYFQEHKKEIYDKYIAIKGALPVVAIVDSDYDITDPDLKNKIFTHSGEIPNNNKDDDGNGWVDDWKILSFIDKTVYRTAGDRSQLSERLGESLYGTQYPPVDIFFRNPDWHGHYMALLTGAEQDNFIGWHGIIPNEVKMLLCTVGHKQITPEGDPWPLMAMAMRDAFDYIHDMKAQGTNIVAVNLSLSGQFAQQNFLGFDLTFGKGAFKKRLEQFNKDGIVFITAAGNDGHNLDYQPEYPASLNMENGIVVGASASYNAIRYAYSNFGQSTVDIFTVAEKDPAMLEHKDIFVGTDITKDINSTSSAAAITTGIFTVASILYPECNHLQVRQLLLESYMDNPKLKGCTKLYNGIPHDGIIRMSGKGRNNLGNLIGLITKDESEKNYHLNVELRKKICGK